MHKKCFGAFKSILAVALKINDDDQRLYFRSTMQGHLIISKLKWNRRINVQVEMNSNEREWERKGKDAVSCQFRQNEWCAMSLQSNLSHASFNQMMVFGPLWDTHKAIYCAFFFIARIAIEIWTIISTAQQTSPGNPY